MSQPHTLCVSGLKQILNEQMAYSIINVSGIPYQLAAKKQKNKKVTLDYATSYKAVAARHGLTGSFKLTCQIKDKALIPIELVEGD